MLFSATDLDNYSNIAKRMTRTTLRMYSLRTGVMIQQQETLRLNSIMTNFILEHFQVSMILISFAST